MCVCRDGRRPVRAVIDRREQLERRALPHELLPVQRIHERTHARLTARLRCVRDDSDDLARPLAIIVVSKRTSHACRADPHPASTAVRTPRSPRSWIARLSFTCFQHRDAVHIKVPIRLGDATLN